MQVTGFDWDEGNRAKRQKHGVSEAEIEYLLTGEISVLPDPLHSSSEERFKAIGRNSKGAMDLRRLHFAYASWQETRAADQRALHA